MTISPPMWDIFHKLLHIRPKDPFPGKVAAIWSKAHPEIEKIVSTEKLQAIRILTEKEVMAPAAPATEQSALFWWRPDGGWPLPHFHLADRIYPATDKQWNTFSAQVLTKVGANLQNAKLQPKVSFNQFMEITEHTAKL